MTLSIKQVAAVERNLRAAIERADRLLEQLAQRADLNGLTPGAPKKIEIIAAAVAKKFGVQERAIFKRDRRQPQTFVRQVCMALACDCLGLPAAVVSRAFRRDHGTVRHARTRVRNRLQTEPSFKRDYESLLAEVSSSLSK